MDGYISNNRHADSYGGHAGPIGAADRERRRLRTTPDEPPQDTTPLLSAKWTLLLLLLETKLESLSWPLAPAEMCSRSRVRIVCVCHVLVCGCVDPSISSRCLTIDAPPNPSQLTSHNHNHTHTVLAEGLRRRGLGSSADGSLRVVFISHADHEEYLRALWNSADGSDAITFIPSPSAPHAATALKGDSSSPEAVEATLRPQAHLQACIDACRHPSSQIRPQLLIANLFALEAVHLAEALDVPLVMAHPYPAPTAAPAAFARHFRWTDPVGYKMLRQAEPGERGKSWCA